MASIMKNFLLVDDSKVNVLKEQFILKDKNVVLYCAQSGEECLRILRQVHMDLVLLDIEMPGMSGLEVLEQIRHNPQTMMIPVICVTSDASLDIIVEASRHGIAGYVKKPFSEEELMTHIKKVFPDYDFGPDLSDVPAIRPIPSGNQGEIFAPQDADELRADLGVDSIKGENPQQ